MAGATCSIYPVLLRSILFAVVFLAFDIAEKLVIGVLHGKTVAQSIETPGGDGILGAVLVAIIIAIALVPYFAFVELSRLMDPGELARIFFIRGPRAAERRKPVSRPVVPHKTFVRATSRIMAPTATPARSLRST